MTTFSTLPRYDYFSTPSHYVYLFHDAPLCLLFPRSCAMATFSTQLCCVSFFPAAPLRILSCADPGIFVCGGGGGGEGVQVNPTFFSLYSSAYFTEIKWLISKKNINIQGSGGGSTFPGQGGSNFFREGSTCLFPIEPHITCDFPGGGPPCPPPSGSTHITCDYAGGGPHVPPPLWIHV